MAGSCEDKRGYLQNAESGRDSLIVKQLMVYLSYKPSSVSRVNRGNQEPRITLLATDMHDLYAVSW